MPPRAVTAMSDAADNTQAYPSIMDAAADIHVQGTPNGRKRPHASAVEPGSETASQSQQDSKPTTESGKRRRRKLSCETCQRLKCRCDFDPVTRTCHRCKTLRRPCSITDDNFYTLPPIPETATKLEIFSDVAERLQAVEATVAEIKELLRDVQSTLKTTQNYGQAHYPAGERIPGASMRDSSTENAGLEDICNPADAGIASAPAAVNRAVTTRLAGARRRVLEHLNLDLVELGLLDEPSADQLIRLFHRHRDRELLLHDIDQSQPSKELRKVSPFLHAVSCLHGMPYASEDWPAINVRREVYKQVRSTLGQAVLSSPLPLDEINAILLMSVYSNQSPSFADSPVDYIDSWLLTGYCAQQAMLSISFSAIIENVKRGMTTHADKQGIQLWANICLHHLHWAATIGRPSTIPARYLDQCSLLLKVTDGTVRESLIVAEITIYTKLNRKLTQHSYLDSEGECQEFASWKEKWFHLFARPKSSTFRLSYHCAYFILAVRSLEDFNSGRAAEDLLSPAAIINDDHQDHHHDMAATNHQSEDQLRYQSYALRFAFHILETFLEMSSNLRNEMPVYLHMCVSYSALVIAQYWREKYLGQVSAGTVLEYLNDLEDWCAGCPSAMIVTSYATALAKRRVQACLRGRQSTSQAPSYVDGLTLGQHGGNRDMTGSPIYSAAEGLLGLGGIPMAEHDGGRSSGSGMKHMVDGSMPDAMLTPLFPSMEDFFAGGFLDFIR